VKLDPRTVYSARWVMPHSSVPSNPKPGIIRLRCMVFVNPLEGRLDWETWGSLYMLWTKESVLVLMVAFALPSGKNPYETRVLKMHHCKW